MVTYNDEEMTGVVEEVAAAIVASTSDTPIVAVAATIGFAVDAASIGAGSQARADFEADFKTSIKTQKRM